MTAVQKARRREAHKLENVPVTLATSIVVFVFVDFYLSICICVFVLVYFCICLYMWICKKTRGHAAGECACHSHLLNISPENLTPAGKWKTIARKIFLRPKEMLLIKLLFENWFCDSKSFLLTTWGLLLWFKAQLAVNSCLHSYLESAIEQQALIISLNLSLHCIFIKCPFWTAIDPSYSVRKAKLTYSREDKGEQCLVSIHVVNIHAQRTTNIVHCGRQRTNLPPAVIFPHKWLTQAK